MNFLSFSIPFVLLFFGSSHREGSKQVQEESLKYVASFPDRESEQYLSGPYNFAFSENRIYISDQFSSTIKVFTYEGEFIENIGRKGRGPDEFEMQSYIQFNSGKLFVVDQGNRRFYIKDLKHDSSRTYPMRDLYRRFAVSSEKIFAYIHNPQRTTNLPLVRVYDHNLNRTGGFGTYLKLTENMYPGASMSFLKADGGKLYVQYSAFPILHIYSLDGQLLKEINVDNEVTAYRERVAVNYQSSSYVRLNQRSMKKLLSGFDINDRGLFYLIYDEDRILIDHYDFEGQLLKRYSRPAPYSDYYILDMKVISRDNQFRYYLLAHADGVPQVDIYEPE